MARPNVLFLFSDQHNARCLSCYEHPDVKTPNLDRLASEGTRFTNAYCNNPICTPSRISYLSSLYPSTHGYYGLYGPEPQQKMTSIFKWYREHGYRTGALGKLHTPRYWIERDCQFVYDEFIEHPKYLEGAGLYGKNDNRKFTGRENDNAGPSELPYEHSVEAALLKQTLRFIDNLGEPADRGDGNAPWLAWMSFARPHQPYTPSEPFASQVPPEKVTLPPVSNDEKLRTINQRLKITEGKLRRIVSAYLGLVAQIDHTIGILLKELEKRNQLENTVIIYAADHGDYAGEHGLFEKQGGISYRAICRVPLIIRYPAFVGRGVRSELVESVDVFPSICDLCGIPEPNTVQGKSMLPLLGENPQAIRQTALTENCYRKAITDGRYRYVTNVGNEPDELYDTQTDSWELNNLIDEADYSEIAVNLLRQLLNRLAHARRPISTIAGSWHNHKLDVDGRADYHALGQNIVGPYF